LHYKNSTKKEERKKRRIDGGRRLELHYHTNKFGVSPELRLSLPSSMGLEASCGFVEAHGFSSFQI
jgi:hypothetical protein